MAEQGLRGGDVMVLLEKVQGECEEWWQRRRGEIALKEGHAEGQAEGLQQRGWCARDKASI